jgi:tetratricopeptide (TPR) repeat protein
MLLGTARTQITSGALSAFKDSRAKYLALAEKDIADAATRTDTMPIYSIYNNLASRLFSAGIFSEEAEDYARKGVAAMDERTYMESRKQRYERSLATFEETTAAAATSTPPSPPAPSYRFAMKDGVMQASLATPAPPRPATPPRAPVRPTMPTDIEMRAGLKAERATALATLGQILMKRGKTQEGEKVLAEAYAAKPASSTMASIARVLAESAKKAGNETLQLEYLTVLALSGRITAGETTDFEAAYRKTHNGSLDGLDAMLDERYRREHVRFAVTPFAPTPPAKPTGRAVLAEVFPGAG